jgi:hypothetical protein
VIFREEHFSEEEYRSVAMLVESRGDDNCGRVEGGKFGPKNTCQEDGGGGAKIAEKSEPKQASVKAPATFRPSPSDRVASLTTRTLFDGSEKIDLPRERGAVREETIARALTNRAIAAHGGVPIDVNKPVDKADIDVLSDSLADDIEGAYDRSGRHAGWYSKDVGDAMDIAASLPGNERIAKDPVDKFVFGFGMGILSAQNGVEDNATFADAFYRNWRETGSLVVPEEYSHVLGRGVDTNHFKTMQALVDKNGWSNIIRYFSSADTVAGIAADGEIRLPGFDGFKVAKEHVSTVVPRLAIFGPKIGPFTHAIVNGDYNHLVMDRWTMRQSGALTGTLLQTTDPEKAKQHAERLLRASSGNRAGGPLWFGLPKSDVIASLKKTAKTGEFDESDFGWEFVRRVQSAYANSVNPQTGGGFGDKTELNLAANNAFKNKVTMQLAPGNGTVANNVRAVFSEATRKTGASNILEVQALGWVDTQNLWKTLGYRLKKDPNENTFSSAFSALRDGRRARIGSLKDEAEKKASERRSLDVPQPSEDGIDFDVIGAEYQCVFDEATSDKDYQDWLVDHISKQVANLSGKESRNVVVLSNPSPDSFAGEIRDAERVVIRSASFAVWPRLGFDAKIPQEIRSRLPEHLSHASTLLDLHATREGTEWWVENGSDVDMELDLRDASTPQAKVFFRCLDSDAASLDGVWEEIWESEDLDDYCGDEQRFLSPEFRDCGQDDLGRFSSGNDCANDDGSGGGIAKDVPPSAKQASKTSGGSGGRTSAKNAWKKDDNAVVLTPSQSKVLAPVKAAMAVSGRLVSESLNEVGVSLDDAATACASLAEDSTVVMLHGDAKSFVLFTGGAELSSEPEPEVTFVSQRPFAGVESGLISIASIARNDEDELSINYALFGVKPEAQKAAPVAVAREMYRGVFDSIANAEKIGVKEIVMKATGDSKDDKFKGYRIWPRLGFDGVIPRKQITPTYSLKWGFFDAYGSSLPDSALSPRAKKERAAGALTIQALYETKEGQDWWEKSGGTMDMIMRVGDEDNPGWQRYKKISSRISGRDVDYESILDAEWRSIREEVESRSADCGRDEGGMFASGNDCASGDGVGSGLAREPSAAAKQRTGGWGGGISAEFGQDNGSAVYTPERPLFKGAEDIGRIEIATPKDVREVLADTMRMTIADAVLASGAVVESPGRARISKPRVSVTNDSEGVYVEWSAAGAATGSGYSGEEKKHAERPGTIVNAVHASRLIYPTDKGAIVYASGLGIHPDFRGMGIAVESVLRTISSPVARVNMDAVRFDSGNPRDRLTGYSIWPKYGYDAPVSKVKEVLRLRHSIGLISSPDIPEKFRSAKTLSDIYAIPGGKEWWAQDGDSIFLSFDVRPRSRSMTTMLDYKARTSRKRSLMQYKNNHGADVDDDAEVLDQIWEKYQKEGLPGNAPTQEEWDEWDKQDAEIRKKAKDGKAREV